jgi:hypothetical protein
MRKNAHARVSAWADGAVRAMVGDCAPVGALSFTATLVPRGPAAAVVLDDQQVQAVGEGAKRFPVLATVNGYTFATTVTRMRGEFLLGLSRAVREAAGVQAGDTVTVRLELDMQERVVDVPQDLDRALARDPEARAAFDAMAYTHRKEFARWVAEAKREDTRRAPRGQGARDDPHAPDPELNEAAPAEDAPRGATPIVQGSQSAQAPWRTTSCSETVSATRCETWRMVRSSSSSVNGVSAPQRSQTRWW